MIGYYDLVLCQIDFGCQKELVNMESKDQKLPFLLGV